MTDVAEEARAVEFRRKMTARSVWECEQRFVAHQSDRPRVLAFRDAWLPWLDRQRDWDPADDCLEQGRGLQIP